MVSVESHLEIAGGLYGRRRASLRPRCPFPSGVLGRSEVLRCSCEFRGPWGIVTRD